MIQKQLKSEDAGFQVSVPPTYQHPTARARSPIETCDRALPNPPCNGDLLVEGAGRLWQISQFTHSPQRPPRFINDGEPNPLGQVWSCASVGAFELSSDFQEPHRLFWASQAIASSSSLGGVMAGHEDERTNEITIYSGPK